MPSQVRIAGAGSNVDLAGGVAWGTPGNIVSDNATNATIALTAQTSDYLVSGSHGFTIPSDAVIDGIAVTLDIVRTSGSSFDASLIKLTKNGTTFPGSIGGSALFVVTILSTIGGSANLWGTTWTPDEINASTFGAAIAHGTSATFSFGIDYISIEVFYTPSTGKVTLPCTFDSDYEGDFPKHVLRR
jgi:hypothetical protein